MEVDLANTLFSWPLDVDPAGLLVDPANLLKNWLPDWVKNLLPDWVLGVGAAGGGIFGGGGPGPGGRPPGFPTYDDLIGAPPNLDFPGADTIDPFDPNNYPNAAPDTGPVPPGSAPSDPHTFDQTTQFDSTAAQEDQIEAGQDEQERARDSREARYPDDTTAPPSSSTTGDQGPGFFEVISGGIQNR